MDDILQPQQNTQQAATLREMSRKANDRIRLANPTEQDFIVRWDGMSFTIPNRNKDVGQGKGQLVVARYIAMNYIKHMTDKMLGENLLKAITEENRKRTDSGMKEIAIDDKERFQYESRYRTDNPDSRKAIIKLLWLGVDEEYGMDMPEEVERTRDPRNTDEQILEELDKPYQPTPEAVSTQTSEASLPPLDRNEDILNEVAA